MQLRSPLLLQNASLDGLSFLLSQQFFCEVKKGCGASVLLYQSQPRKSYIKHLSRRLSIIICHKNITNFVSTNVFLYVFSINSYCLRMKKSFSFSCIISKSCFTKHTLIQRIHLHNSIPIFGKILLFLKIKKCFHLLFIQNFKPTLKLFISTLFCTILNFCFFQKRNPWNWSCFIKKPKRFHIQA